MEDRFQISLSTDAEGFLSQQCPSCARRFKVKLDEDGEHALRHCPYCGAESSNGWEGWLTDEQRRHVEAKATEFAADVADRMFEDVSQGFEGLSYETASTGHQSSPPPLELDEPMPCFMSVCCHEAVKLDSSIAIAYCIVCGARTPT